MTRQRLALTLCLALAGLSGCATEAAYLGLQSAARQACDRRPPGERADCLARVYPGSYADYEKERARAAR